MMAVLTADTCKPVSQHARIQVSENDLFRDKTVVSDLMLIFVGIDLFKWLTIVFDQLILHTNLK